MRQNPRDQNTAAFIDVPFGDMGSKSPGQITRLEELAARLYRVENQVANNNDKISPSGTIQNLLRNSDFSYSQLNYDGTGTADDVFGWVRGVNPANLINNASSGVRWDKSNGGLRVLNGSLADDISYNFSKRVLLPGQTYFLMFLAKLESAANLTGAQLEYGAWDSSPGIENWVTASLVGSASSTAPTITVVGAAGTTTYTYKVVAVLSDGSVVVSSAATTTTGNATLNSTNYNALAWASVPSVVRYDVYRTVGGTVGLIASIVSGATSWNDQGATLQAGAVVPPSTATQARSTWADIGSNLSASDWVSFRFQLDIPSAYALAQTQTGQQWLRIGFRNIPGGAPAILIDRVGLSLSAGEWAPASDDANATGDISITPTSDGGRGKPRIVHVGVRWYIYFGNSTTPTYIV